MTEVLTPIPTLPMERSLATPPLRDCGTCDRGIEETQPEWAKQCRTCYGDPSTKRRCRVCLGQVIPNCEPEWKQVCGSCYKNAAKKPCASCFLPSIPDYEPKWKNICGACYKDESKYKTCTTCKKKTIKPGVAAHITQCGKCRKQRWLEKRQREEKTERREGNQKNEIGSF